MKAPFNLSTGLRFFCCLFLLNAAPLQAREMLYLVADSWPPYINRDQPGTGLAVELVKQAFVRADYQVNFALEQRPRVLEGAEIGVFDVVVAVWPTHERDALLEFSSPYLTNDIRLITKKKRADIKFQQLDDLRGLLIGVVKDFAYDDAFNRSRNLVKIEQNHLLQSLDSLMKDEIDVVVGDQRSFGFLLHAYFKANIKELSLLEKPLSRQGLCIGVSRLHPKRKQILQRFQQGMDAMKQDGSYQAIVNEYEKYNVSRLD